MLNVMVASTRSISLIRGGSKTGRKRAAVRRLIIKMFVYSAIKMRAKVPDLYSVLNPETSSDSPSARSKGVRLVSARHEINQILVMGHMIIIIGAACL